MPQEGQNEPHHRTTELRDLHARLLSEWVMAARTNAERDVIGYWRRRLAVAGIAFGQALVIFDGLAVAHPAWEPWQRAVVALGFELAVLVTGVAIMVTGADDRKLILGEVLLVALSVSVGLWMIVTGPATNRWIVALSLGLLPAQYLVATYALHRLYAAGSVVQLHQVEASPAAVLDRSAAPLVAVQVNNRVATAAAAGDKAARQAWIRALIAERPSFTVRELVDTTGASPATVKRDLAEIRRGHG